MKRVGLTLDAAGREAEIHPMYDVLVGATEVERATAMHWNVAGDELGIVHYVEGDIETFREHLERIPEVLDYALAPAGSDAFYAYVRDATTEPLRELIDAVSRSPVVVVPPVEYGDGVVSCTVFGPAAEIQTALDDVPEPVEATVTAVGGMTAVPGVLESVLTDRQREALEAALSLGYYAVPREASHEDVAEEIGCAPSTAAEHLRKGESRVIRSALAEPPSRRGGRR
ncbi:helix-turn-helix domain-containing protein [Natrarchaeobius oligotrophus]|uniref:Helix-turn-helix domain-containing protein n=1 Tax=Natrarchaeobius chitinivorans TaxID=1679083 RepID=A0A3N6MNP5_NATCH|nr:helix-turn-helix domain-containing protein [Natrarchaeobius chitinivorans]RQH03295.1 helix-turn-helix domain-containing protein [Natrarchaeobius chitinivorans]